MSNVQFYQLVLNLFLGGAATLAAIGIGKAIRMAADYFKPRDRIIDEEIPYP